MHGDRTRRWRLLHAKSLVLAVWRARPDVGQQVRRHARQTALSWFRREAPDRGKSAARESAPVSPSASVPASSRMPGRSRTASYILRRRARAAGGRLNEIINDAGAILHGIIIPVQNCDFLPPLRRIFATHPPTPRLPRGRPTSLIITAARLWTCRPPLRKCVGNPTFRRQGAADAPALKLIARNGSSARCALERNIGTQDRSPRSIARPALRFNSCCKRKRNAPALAVIRAASSSWTGMTCV